MEPGFACKKVCTAPGGGTLPSGITPSGQTPLPKMHTHARLHPHTQWFVGEHTAWEKVMRVNCVSSCFITSIKCELWSKPDGGNKVETYDTIVDVSLCEGKNRISPDIPSQTHSTQVSVLLSGSQWPELSAEGVFRESWWSLMLCYLIERYCVRKTKESKNTQKVKAGLKPGTGRAVFVFVQRGRLQPSPRLWRLGRSAFCTPTRSTALATSAGSDRFSAAWEKPVHLFCLFSPPIFWIVFWTLTGEQHAIYIFTAYWIPTNSWGN